MRTREIKPGFYRNEQLAECSAFARLIFPGLWMLADGEGRFEYRPKRIKAELLPYDSVDMDALMSELEANDLIRRYEVDGKKYCWIPTFTLHQRVHPKEAQSTIPPHPDEKPRLGDTQTTPRYVQDNTQDEPEQHLGDVESRSYSSLSSLSSLSGNLKTHPLPLASEGDGDAVSNSPHGSRKDGTNPRALGNNPRAQGMNPRAQDENPRAQGTNPRAGNKTRASPTAYSQAFLAFWQVYPRKTGKDAAWKAWRNRKGDLPDADELAAIIERQCHSDQWQRDGGQYIPHPATWLNQGRWKDEQETRQEARLAYPEGW